MKLRGPGLTGTVLLHLLGLAWLLMPSLHPQGSAPAHSIEMRLFAEPSETARTLPTVPLQVTLPTPRIADIAAPPLPPVAESRVAAMPSAPLNVAVTAPSVAPAVAIASTEPELQAAQPPGRECAERGIARHYPPMLRERGIEGRVVLRVRVDELGQPAEVRILDGSGWRLMDEAARQMTQECRFQPARRGSQPLASWIEYPVRFALNGS